MTTTVLSLPSELCDALAHASSVSPPELANPWLEPTSISTTDLPRLLAMAAYEFDYCHKVLAEVDPANDPEPSATEDFKRWSREALELVQWAVAQLRSSAEPS